MKNLEGIVSAISAGANNESFATTSSCMLMLAVVLSLAVMPVIIAKLRKN